MNKKVIFFILFILFFSCKDKVTHKKSIDIKEEIQEEKLIYFNLKELTLPFNSNSLDYTNKDDYGYFIYDSTFKNNKGFHSLSRILGKVELNHTIDLLLLEKKPKGDEHTEPIITIYSISKLDESKIDSLNIYETIEYEATLENRFIINKDKSIVIYEYFGGYDFLEDGRDTLIIDETEKKYKVSELGSFVLQDNNK